MENKFFIESRGDPFIIDSPIVKETMETLKYIVSSYIGKQNRDSTNIIESSIGRFK